MDKLWNWLTEAETSINVLANAIEQEDALEECVLYKKLNKQFEDIQAEIDAHSNILKNIDEKKQENMIKALGNSNAAAALQHKIMYMNERWSDLKAKLACISFRGCIEYTIVCKQKIMHQHALHFGLGFVAFSNGRTYHQYGT
ncbi:utrophin-like [Notamacropus eugenii]|uniref:utrophin-like n=1 Tax=Notamacropus eugenii TaxID=9315 RepID=UPI003B66C943